ncbi:MmgE/PrpD family protein [Planctomycetales bacterium ZRK34]|nr:MmgE/PrpD family protein [Planctomycetales bacterium ZRK34]
MSKCKALLFIVLLLSAGEVWADEPESAPQQTVTEALAKLAIETPPEALTEAARHAARRAVMDAIGCALAGHDAPGVKPVVEQMLDWGGKPEATVWGSGQKLPAPAAAFVNSTMTHALDLDDVHIPTTVHITSTIVPAAFAVGQAEGASGEQVIEAIILGIEVTGRLGVPFKQHKQHGGFLPSSIIGGFGATAAACRLKGLTAQQTVDAMGIFYAQASGNRQALFDRTLTKRIQPAIAARAAVVAASLAQRGMTGPHEAVEGEAGLARIYGQCKGKPITAADVIGPRDFFEVERIGYKRWACCGWAHYLLKATLDLITEHDLKPADIAEVELFGVGVNGGVVGVPWQQTDTPQPMAQFCAPYEVASLIHNRRFGPAEIEPERIVNDKAVDAFATERVTLRHAKQFGGKYPGGHVVRLTLTDGRTLVESEPTRKLFAPEAFSDEDLTAKFKYNAEYSKLVPAEKIDAMADDLWRLEHFEKISDFVTKYLALSN